MQLSLNKLANIILIGIAGVLFVLGVNYSLIFDQIAWRSLNLILLILLPITLAFLLVFLCTKSFQLKLGALLSISSILLSLYIFEISLQFGAHRLFAQKDFDIRSRAEVVRDLRAQGIQAFPIVSPWVFFKSPLLLEGRRLFPLSGIGNVTTVFCNELGSYYNYQSDPHGFNNPVGVWNHSKVKLLLLGDSFTHGMCVPDGGIYAEQLRQQQPSLLNLGFNGNGPLLKLASLREYGQRVNPEVVLWFYYEGNDIEDLANELKDPSILPYLNDKDYSQNLFAQKPAIDDAIKHFVESELERELPSNKSGDWQRRKKKFFYSIKPTITLYSIRSLLGVVDATNIWPDQKLFDKSEARHQILTTLRQIFVEAQQQVKSQDGHLGLVYLPAHRHFQRGRENTWRRHVLEISADLGVPTLDILQAFQGSGDPLKYFPNRADGHYTKEGNQVVANAVFEFINELK